MRGRGDGRHDFRASNRTARSRAIARVARPPIPLSRLAWLPLLLLWATLAVLFFVFGSIKVFAVSETGAGSPGPLSADPAASAPNCPNGFVLDYAGLPPGMILGEQYATLGVHISGSTTRADLPDAVVVFNSDGTGSHDPDLEVHIGNIAILA